MEEYKDIREEMFYRMIEKRGFERTIELQKKVDVLLKISTEPTDQSSKA